MKKYVVIVVIKIQKFSLDIINTTVDSRYL